MPQKTKIDYETVEKEIEYIQCDVPHCLNTDKEKEIIELAVNPRYTVNEWAEPTVVEGFENEEEAWSCVKEKDRERKKHNIPPGLQDVSPSYYRGYVQEREVTNVDADATFFVCENCLKDHFEAVPDRYNPSDVTEIESRKGNVLVHQPIEPMFSIPDWITIILLPMLSVVAFHLIF